MPRTTTTPRSRAVGLLVPLFVLAAVTLGVYVVRPGVVENGLRSPRVWLAVLAVVLAGRLAALLVQRMTSRPALATAASYGLIAVLGIALLAPSFRQRTVQESFLTAAGPSAPEPSAVTAPAHPTASPAQTGPAPSPSSSPDPASPPAPPAPSPPAGPRELSSGGLVGIGHSGSGRTALYAVDGRTVLRFEDVDIEGTPGPAVYLVPKGARTPDGGVGLGALTAERGSFGYDLPVGVDGSADWTVLVWCEPFDTPVAASDH